MNITVFVNKGNVFASCECIHGYAFKNAVSLVKCALLPVICADFGCLQDNCVNFDRVECLLPYNNPV